MGFLMSKSCFLYGLAFLAGTVSCFAQASLESDLNSIKFNSHLNNLYEDLTLPAKGASGSTITWKSSDPSYMTDAGHIVAKDIGAAHHVTLTATATSGGQSSSKKFDIYIHEHEPYTNYLFAYFPANNNENIYYALSRDGYNFTPMNGGNRVIAADSVSIKKGLRDPHVLRAPDGWFYMVHTDMKSAEGWSSNRGMVLMKSKDLINWKHATIHFPDRYKGKNFANVTRVWAPETVWDYGYKNTDGSTGRIMVYFSLLTDDGTITYDKVYYQYANDDFTDLLGDPIYFFDRGSATIDMDIVYNPNDSLYHAFFKNEGQGGICKVTAKTLTAPAGKEGSQWSKPSGTLQQTTEAVEGAGVFKLINKDSWILMYDCYNNGHYQFTSSPDLSTFKFVQNTEMKGAFTPRHGTVLPITAEETAALMKAFPTADFEPFVAKYDTISNAGGKVTVSACPHVDVVPYVKIGDGGWEESTDLNVKVGETVQFGPHPWDGKDWKWAGPDDFSATTREVTLKNLDGTKSGYYTVSYIYSPGCETKVKYKLVVDDPSHPFVEPVVEDTTEEQPGGPQQSDDGKDSGEIHPGDSSTSINGVETFAGGRLEFGGKRVQVLYYSVGGMLMQGKPTAAGVYIRKEYLNNGLAKVTRIRVQ